MIYVNTRILFKSITGVQRYLMSIVESGCFEDACLVSDNILHGHVWEQFMLPHELSKSDVLWSPSNTGPIFCPAKQVVTMHDFATLDHPEWTNRQFSTFYRFLLPKLAKKCDGIIAISEYTKSRILHHVDINPDKVVVIKNGVDQKFYKSSEIERNIDSVLSKYGITSGRYILSVSSIEPRKNIASLLKAWELVHSQIDDDISLVLVGRSNPRIFADAGLTRIPPRVLFTGFVEDDDLPLIYQNAYLFAYLSLYEGFGLPPLEAMASGVAVLTSNTTSIPEVVGDNAITVNPRSVNDIAENLLYLLQSDSLRAKLAALGPHHARSFDWSNTAAATFKYLKRFEYSGEQ